VDLCTHMREIVYRFCWFFLWRVTPTTKTIPQASYNNFSISFALGQWPHCKFCCRRLPWVTPIGNSALLRQPRSAAPHTRLQSVRRCVCWR